MNGWVNGLSRRELTACSQVWPSQVLLPATCFNILDKLLILPCPEIFHEDFWIHVGEKKFLFKTGPHWSPPSTPTPLGPLSAGANHGGLL